MSVCLRCDWRGATASPACPRCAAPLFRPAPPARRPPDLTDPATTDPPTTTPLPTDVEAPAVPPPPPLPGAPATDVPSADVEPADRAATGGRRIAAAVPALVLAFVVVVVTIATGDPTTSTDPASAAGAPAGERLTSPTALRGSLVYSRFTPSADRVQLWVWDLERNEVRAGPIVPKPIRLVAATAVRVGEIGLTWRRPDGSLEAGLLRSLDEAAVPRRVIDGELVAWSPRGGRVSAARLERTRPCPRPIAIRSLRLRPRLREPAFRTRLCGDVLSLVGDGAVTYFTLRLGDRVHVAYAGSGRPRIVLKDHAILDVSWAGDMIVQAMTPPDVLARFRKLPAPDGAPPLLPGQIGYFSRRTTEPDPMPVPFTSADDPFSLGAILAWSPNSFEALAVGAFRGMPGVYVLDTLPGDGIDAPRWLLEASGPTSATYTGDGVPIVLTGGDVHAVVDDVVTEVPMPIGSPLADGRVAWIP